MVLWAPSYPFPEPARWLATATPPQVRGLIKRVLLDIGICEMPPGSNRSGVIDAANIRAGVKVGSYWCASWLGGCWLDAGLPVPSGYASCDNWMNWAKQTGRWIPPEGKPPVGSAVLYGKPGDLYGKPGDAQHIGGLVRVTPIMASVEGNTTVEGAAFASTRNGIAVSLKEVTSGDPVLGYVAPFAYPSRLSLV